MESRTPVDNSIAHVVNIDIEDNLEEATIGAFLIGDMCLMVTVHYNALRLILMLFLQLAKSEDLDNDIEEILHNFEEKCQQPILHSIVFN